MRVGWVAVMLAMTVGGCGRIGFGDSPGGADAAQPDAPILGKVVATQLSVEWVLPLSARLSWTRTGGETDYQETRVILGPTLEAVDQRNSQATISDSSDYPGLAFWELPSSNTETSAINVIELDAGQTYFAQVEIVDTDGATSTTDIVSFDTPTAFTNELVLFDETDTAGYSIPGDFQFTNAPTARTGDALYQYVFDCGAEEWCFENLRRQAVAVALNVIDDASFANAYFEMHVEIDGPRPSFWSQLRIWLEPGGDDALLFNVNGFTVPANVGYSKIQLPLSEFHNGTRKLVASDLAAGLFEWGIGGQWPDEAPIRVDDVVIYY